MLDSGGRVGEVRAAINRASSCLLFPIAVLDRCRCRFVAAAAVAVVVEEE